MPTPSSPTPVISHEKTFDLTNRIQHPEERAAMRAYISAAEQREQELSKDATYWEGRALKAEKRQAALPAAIEALEELLAAADDLAMSSNRSSCDAAIIKAGHALALLKGQ